MQQLTSLCYVKQNHYIFKKKNKKKQQTGNHFVQLSITTLKSSVLKEVLLAHLNLHFIPK